MVGEKRARQLWFLLDRIDAQTAERWGLVNAVVPADGAAADRARSGAAGSAGYSPTALRFLKHSFNADTDHLGGLSHLAFDGLELFAHSEEGMEGARAFAERRDPDFSRFRAAPDAVRVVDAHDGSSAPARWIRPVCSVDRRPGRPSRPLTCDHLVTYFGLVTDEDDRVFKALADPTRRFLLDRLFERDGRTLTELESELEMTRFGVMKHLKVLEDAGLVVARRSGREKRHFLNPVPIRLIHDRWIDKYTERQLSALADLKKQLEEPS